MSEEAAVLNETTTFEVLVKKYMKRAYFTALGLTGSHDAAMDLSQEAFVRAYKNFNSYDPSRNFFTWYYRILKNLCLNYIRDKKKSKEVNFIELRKIEAEDFSGAYDKKELREKLQSALMLLDEDDREIIILREFECLDYRTISQMLNLPQGTVMSRLFYARKKLAQILKDML